MEKYFMIIKLKLEKKTNYSLNSQFTPRREAEKHDEGEDEREKWNLWNFHHEFKSEAASLLTKVSSLSYKFTFHDL